MRDTSHARDSPIVLELQEEVEGRCSELFGRRFTRRLKKLDLLLDILPVEEWKSSSARHLSVKGLRITDRRISRWQCPTLFESILISFNGTFKINYHVLRIYTRLTSSNESCKNVDRFQNYFEFQQTELEYSTKVKSSDFRVVRVVDTEGHIRVVRENTQTEFTCSRQGYFVHPKSCNRYVSLSLQIFFTL